MDEKIINWLLEKDVSLQYQVHRDLLSISRPDLQRRIAHEDWETAFIKERHPEGHWGRGFYQPKWTSSYYTRLDLKTI